MTTDWDVLKAAAVEASRHSYAPYSHYKVGAAAIVDDGRVVTGCNVENASYGLSLCAECGLVSQLHATGGGQLTDFLVVNEVGDLITPCGRCRQLLHEAGGAALRVLTADGVKHMRDLLPDEFGPGDLDFVAGTGV